MLKISFHTAISEEGIFNLMAKLQCQLTVIVIHEQNTSETSPETSPDHSPMEAPPELPKKFKWSWHLDKKTHSPFKQGQQNKVEEVRDQPSAFGFTFQLDQEFSLPLPIVGESVKVRGQNFSSA